MYTTRERVLRNITAMSNSGTAIKTRRLFMTSARGKSNHTLIEFVHARLHYLRQFGL